jgi:hypothetical protein
MIGHPAAPTFLPGGMVCLSHKKARSEWPNYGVRAITRLDSSDCRSIRLTKSYQGVFAFADRIPKSLGISP